MSANRKRESGAGITPTRRPSLKLNAVSNWGPLAVNFIAGLLLTPYLIGHLGKPGYGVWALVGSLLGYYGLLRLGVGAGIMRYVPFYRGKNDQKSASQVVSTAMVMFLAIGSAILLISMLLAEPIARFYEGGAELASLIRILGVAAAIECPQRVLDACIRSHEHWVAVNSAAIARGITRALGLAGCVYFGYGVVEMGYVIIAVTVFAFVLVAFLFARFCPDIQLRPSMVKLSHVQTLVSFGILTAIITLAYTLTLQGHSLIIGKLISLDAVTVYAIPVLLIRNIRQGLLAPVRVFWPRFAHLDGKNRSDKVASLFLRGTRLTAIFASGVMLIVFVVGPSFIRLWVGESFEAAYPVLLLLAVGYLVETSQAVMPHLLGATGHQKMRTMFATFEGTIGIGLSIILSWQLGLVGAALGFVIAIVLMRGVVCPWYTCHLLGISLMGYYRQNLLLPCLILPAPFLAAHYVNIVVWADNWFSFFWMLVLSCSIYVVYIYSIVLSDEEKKYLVNVFPWTRFVCRRKW